MHKIQLEEQQVRKKRYILLASMILGISAILAVFQLLLSNQLAGFGMQVAQLNEKEKTLVLENERLQKQIAQETAIAKISERAKQLSLTNPTEFLTIEETGSFALLR